MQFFKVALFCRASSIKKSKHCCHPPFHPPPPPIFRRHSLKLLSSTLLILMNWILLSPAPLSADPDTPQKKIWNVHLGINCTYWWINLNARIFQSTKKLTDLHWSKFVLILLYFGYKNMRLTFPKGVKSKVKVVTHERSHTSYNQARSTSGGGTKSNPVQIILGCFTQTFERYNCCNALDHILWRETMSLD